MNKPPAQQDAIRAEIARKVRALRESRNMTQADLSKKLGMSQGRFSVIERGEGSFSAEQIVEILRVFNATLGDLVGATETAAAEAILQNALARLGAAHLAEDARILPSTQLTEVEAVLTDDWPTYLYAGLLGETRVLRWLMGPVVRKSVSRLLDATDAPLAFGHPMAEEYAARYGKTFTVLSHADYPRRFESAQPVRVHPAGTLTIMAVGNFRNRFRWPLLLDANESCRLLNEQGIPARVAVLSSAIDPEGGASTCQGGFYRYF